MTGSSYPVARLQNLLASFLDEADALVFLCVSPAGEILDARGAWASVLGEPAPPIGLSMVDRIGTDAWRQLQAAPSEGWTVLPLTWSLPGSCVRALEARLRSGPGEYLLLVMPGLWTDERGLQELSRLHEQLINTNRELQRKNRELEAARARLATLATTDPLTGLANRRSIEEALARSLSYARRHRAPLGVVAADVDHFKEINDTYGHAVGDRVLVAFARLLDEATRHEDLAARMGGEEFLLLLPGTPAAGCRAVAERLRAAIAALRIDPLTRPVTVSFGIAAFRPADTVETLLARADRGLYAAKRGGRNRVEALPEDEDVATGPAQPASS